MNKQEVFALIRRNKNSRNEAIILIADFLVTSRERAAKIYDKEFGQNEKQPESKE